MEHTNSFDPTTGKDPDDNEGLVKCWHPVEEFTFERPENCLIDVNTSPHTYVHRELVYCYSKTVSESLDEMNDLLEMFNKQINNE